MSPSVLRHKINDLRAILLDFVKIFRLRQLYKKKITATLVLLINQIPYLVC